jgi:phosphatidylinositol alpha-1,6-mannosyltransferase
LLMRAVARRVDVVTYLGDETRRRLAPALPVGGVTMRLTGGVDSERFCPGAGGGEIRRRLGWTEHRVVVSASRLVPRKGQAILLRAWPEIRRRHADARLLIVGAGPRRPFLEREVAALGLAEDVCFTGSVADDQLPAYLAAGDVFALPCHDLWQGLQVEGLGLSILEASAAGLPVVVGRSGGTPDAVIDGVTGQLVDGTSAREVAGAVNALLDDPQRARQLGAAGREWVTREWGWDQLAERLRAALCPSTIGEQLPVVGVRRQDVEAVLPTASGQPRSTAVATRRPAGQVLDESLPAVVDNRRGVALDRHAGRSSQSGASGGVLDQ